MPKRHADLFEVGFDQVGQDARVDLMLAEQGFVLSEVDRVQPLGDVHRRSRARFDSDDGPRETASPGGERWPAAMGSIRPVHYPVGECLLFACAVRRRRFPVGASPTRRSSAEATGAVMEVTKWLKPSV